MWFYGENKMNYQEKHRKIEDILEKYLNESPLKGVYDGMTRWEIAKIILREIEEEEPNPYEKKQYPINNENEEAIEKENELNEPFK